MSRHIRLGVVQSALIVAERQRRLVLRAWSESGTARAGRWVVISLSRTMRDELAYACSYRSEAKRAAAFPAWLHHCNHHRGHTSLKGRPPAGLDP